MIPAREHSHLLEKEVLRATVISYLPAEPLQLSLLRYRNLTYFIFPHIAARPHDFFDAQTLDAIRHRAICFNISAQIESLGKGNSVVFHSTVIAKRKEESGKVKLLLHWTPEDILPDAWVNETERHQLKTKVVHLSKLPRDTAVLLDPNIYRSPINRMAHSGSLKDHCS